MEFCGHTVRRINHVGDWGTQVPGAASRGRLIYT
jgi:arginyl-tRNA synthetase